MPHEVFIGELQKALAESRTLADDAPVVFRQVRKELEDERTEGNKNKTVEEQRAAITEAQERDALARRLVGSLGSTFWDAVVSVRAHPEDGLTAWHEGAATHAANADAIARHARELLDLLGRLDAVTREAISRGYLPPTSLTLPAPLRRSLGEMMMGFQPHEWTAAVEARKVLAQMVRDAKVWAMEARKDAKRPRGPRVNSARVDLSEWVAFQLKRAGVRPTEGKTTTFGRVLSLVQLAAGFPAGRDTGRDMRHVLSDPSVWKLIRTF
jgi:hypothetical protein